MSADVKATPTVEKIIENFKRIYPNDIIVAYTYPAGGAITFNGEELLCVRLSDGDWLEIYKLSSSTGPHMDEDKIKSLVFPFVYDTKHITDSVERRNTLRDKLKPLFPNHNVNIVLFDNGAWARHCTNSKGTAYFEINYGSEIDIILS